MRHDQALFSSFSPPSAIPQDAQVIFVADAFADQYLGGAEMTLQALIDTAPCKVHKVRCSELSVQHLEQGIEKYWIFGNYATLNPQLLPTIAANIRYSIVECDYKFCRHRSPEKHLALEGKACDCATGEISSVISSFMAAADHLWWMSEAQRDVYFAKFPFLVDYHNTVLSSVFDDEFFKRVEALRAANLTKNGKWLVLDHSSWIKGTDTAKTTADAEGLDYEVVGSLPYNDMLSRLAKAEGLVFTPLGGDTCPRLVIEAKLLGCKLLLNDNVQHAKEAWFDTDNLETIEGYLRAAPAIFWKGITRHMEREYTLSGYATTYNCVKQEYPFEACIRSLLGFCDEVVVVDAGSTDGTLERLRELQAMHMVPGSEELNSNDTELEIGSRLKVHVVERDWSDPRSALFDGMQKAEARQRCTGDFVWQQDVDEVVRHEDWPKVRDLIANFPKAVPMLALPVIEYWGGFGKVRLDVTPWKWRLSRNSPRITHGVPAPLRDTDSEGRLIAKPGTDGCDPIDANNGEPIVFLGFLTNEMEQVRHQALNGDAAALTKYEEWFSNVVANVPSVYHLSWLDIERKIRLYATNSDSYGWSRHWETLNGKKYVDVKNNNHFFDKPWSQVTDDDIKQKAKELAEKTGGHIFHSRWNGQVTPWMTLKDVEIPKEVRCLKVSKQPSKTSNDV